MFYKKEENGSWYSGAQVYIATGEVLTEQNRDNDFGWIWYDEAPEEYVEWLNELLNGKSKN